MSERAWKGSEGPQLATSSGINLKQDVWLSEVMGWDCWNLECASDSDPDALRQVLPRSGMITARVPVSSPDQLTALLGIGFRLVDISVTLVRPAGVDGGSGTSGLAVGSDATVVVQRAETSDADWMSAMAVSSFTMSRFHTDPAIPADLARRVKGQWARNLAVGARGEYCLKAMRSGTPLGFLGVTQTRGATTEATIDLVAVLPNAQGSGVGRSLLQNFHKLCNKRGIGSRVGTQLRNFPAIKFYERLGYCCSHGEFVLHAHVGRSEAP